MALWSFSRPNADKGRCMLTCTIHAEVHFENMFWPNKSIRQVEAALSAAFSPLVHLEVINESHGRQEDESHFKVN